MYILCDTVYTDQHWLISLVTADKESTGEELSVSPPAALSDLNNNNNTEHKMN